MLSEGVRWVSYAKMQGLSYFTYSIDHQRPITFSSYVGGFSFVWSCIAWLPSQTYSDITVGIVYIYIYIYIYISKTSCVL